RQMCIRDRLIPTLNDSADEIKRMAAWIVKELGPDVPVHFTRFHPNYKLRNLPVTPAQTLRRARETAMAEGCRFVYTGNIPGEPGENTYCPNCKATVVARYGFMARPEGLKEGKCAKCGEAIPGVWS
ncbi:MAG: radical SAM protein, partial [Kiritimatiellae bacterium]|nr:radical SAM protein [Kiritimatiellia bacterium]